MWVPECGRCTSLISPRPPPHPWGGTLPLFDPPYARPSPVSVTQRIAFSALRNASRPLVLVPSLPNAQRLFFLTSQTRRRFRTYSALSAIVAKTSRRVAGKTNGETDTIYCGLFDSFGLDEREQQHHDIYSVLLSPLPPSLPASSRAARPGTGAEPQDRPA